MGSNLYIELYRIGSAATDVGLHEWLHRFVVVGGLMLIGLIVKRCLRLFARAIGPVSSVIAVTLVLSGGIAAAQEPSEAEMAERLHFLEARLKAESVQARAWEGGWAAVYVVGFGYGVYQMGTSTNRSQLAEGIVGASKPGVGVLGLMLTPPHAAQGAHPLDGLAEGTPEELRHKLVLAESLLRANDKEVDQRYAWMPHLLSIALSIAGGIAIWASGDFWKGAQSAGIGSAVGEVTIWTRPWKARKDLRAYRRQFGDFVGEYAAAVPPRSSLRVAAGSMQVAF